MRTNKSSIEEMLKNISYDDLGPVTTFDSFGEWEIAHLYSRADAIEEGVLIDVSSTAKELGIVYPTALTSTCWADAVALPHGADWGTEQARLNVLLERAIDELNLSGGDHAVFDLHVLDGPCSERRVQLRASFVPDDDLRPVITVMLAKED